MEKAVDCLEELVAETLAVNVVVSMNPVPIFGQQPPEPEPQQLEGGSNADSEETATASCNVDEVIEACFQRYDLDSSDTINSPEELNQLVTSLLLKIGGLEESEITVDDLCATLDTQQEPLTLPVFSEWFKSAYNLK